MNYLIKKCLILFSLSVLLSNSPSMAQNLFEHVISFSENEYLERNQRSMDIMGMQTSINEMNQDNSGILISSRSNDVIWQLSIHFKDVSGILVYFDELQLPLEAKVRAYSKDDPSLKTRSFSGRELIENMSFALPIVWDNHIIVEFTFPDLQSVDRMSYKINQVGGLWRGFGDSLDCYANVNCPEGDSWLDQIRSVVRYIHTTDGDINSCGGVLLNNTASDCRPLLLSAQHCAKTLNAEELNQIIFYFNYQAPNCENPNTDQGLDQQTVVGCQRLAASGPGEGGPVTPEGTDFLLFELNDIPEDYQVYYSGWNRHMEEEVEGPGVIIHHPAGDLKKLSFWDDFRYSLSDFSVHNVISENGQGTVEAGSSGSPIFDNNKLVFGTITTGAASCITDPKEAFYESGGGILFYHWDVNGTTADLQLKPWLDPENSGVMTLVGKSSCMPTANENLLPSATMWQIYPNPANERINIQFLESEFSMRDSHIQIYDILGNPLIKKEISHSSQFSIDVSKLPSGTYQVFMVDKLGVSISYNKLILL